MEKILMILFAVLLALTGCSSDNDDAAGSKTEQPQQAENVLSYDGDKVDVVGARFEDVASQGEVTTIPIRLYLDEKGDNYLSVEFDGKDLNKEVDLTDRANNYWIIYNNGSAHYNWYQNENSTSTADFINGSRLRVVRNNGGVYTVDVNVEFTSGVSAHTLTAHYSGVVLNNWIDK